DPDGDLLTYHWSFGDGTNGTGSTITHRFGLGGAYTVTASVSDTNGGTAGSSLILSVEEETEAIEEPVPLPNWPLGPKTALFIRTTFPDRPSLDYPGETRAAARAEALRQWIEQVSYGRATISRSVVTPLLTMPFPSAS